MHFYCNASTLNMLIIEWIKLHTDWLFCRYCDIGFDNDNLEFYYFNYVHPVLIINEFSYLFIAADEDCVVIET